MVGAAEEARGLRWLGTLFRRKGDRQTPADESIFAAAEGAVCSPAQQDPVPPNTSNWKNPIICTSFKGKEIYFI